MINVIAFDLFGTVLDWRGGIVAEGQRLAGHLDPQPDWDAFATAWAQVYSADVTNMRHYTNLDAMLVGGFYQIAPRFGLGALSFADQQELSTAWHRLHPWPDAVAGFSKLGTKFHLSALSNANHSMLIELARSSGLPWHCQFSAETSRCYKPCPQIYLDALRSLGCPADQVLMVAAHTFDLNAAAKQGMRTALVARPSEAGSDPKGLDHQADYVVQDLVELAAILAPKGRTTS